MLPVPLELLTISCVLLLFDMPESIVFNNFSKHLNIFGPEWNILTTIEWIALEFGTDIHVHLRIHWTILSDLLTFYLEQSGQDFLMRKYLQN